MSSFRRVPGPLRENAGETRSGRRGVGTAAGGGALTFAVVVELEHLGAVRDLYGDHRDDIDASFASRILAEVPDAQFGRMGHSRIEFFFFASDQAAGRRRLEAIGAALESRLEIDGHAFEFPVTMGSAYGSDGGFSDERMIEAAEHALSQARSNHQKIAFYDETARAARADRVALLRDLRKALDTDDIYLAYQAKLETRTGGIAGAEALIRWRHPQRGLVPPDHFIGLAEQTGEIRHITERVLDRALCDQAAMAAAGVNLPLHVNVSGALFCDRRFVEWALHRLSQAAGVIGLEITETAVITNPEHAIEHMRAFAEAGVPLAIDDYGSGLSSLTYLKQLPANELKIDKAFISGLTSSQRDPLIVRSTIDLAHALDMKVTAEGVDEPASRALLTVMGCDLLQGYGISRPLTLDAFIAFVQAHAPSPGSRRTLHSGASRLRDKFSFR